jgi:hypothetical protein
MRQPRQNATVMLPRPHEDVVSERVGEDLVLVHLGTNEIFALNTTGARFWELMAQGESREQIESRLLDEYDVGPAELAREIDQLLSELTRQQMVRTA